MKEKRSTLRCIFLKSQNCRKHNLREREREKLSEKLPLKVRRRQILYHFLKRRDNEGSRTRGRLTFTIVM